MARNEKFNCKINYDINKGGTALFGKAKWAAGKHNVGSFRLR